MNYNFLKIKVLITIFLFHTIVGCNNDEIIEICSPDKTQYLTIITNNNEKYVYLKKSSGIVKSELKEDIGYVKFDIKDVTEFGEAIFVCWKNTNYDLELLCPKAKVLINTLDTNIYKISTSYELNTIGTPEVTRYHQKGCFEFGYSKTIRNGEGTISVRN